MLRQDHPKPNGHVHSCYGTRSPLQDLTRIIKITYWILMPH
jgi:hypothetical protein